MNYNCNVILCLDNNGFPQQSIQNNKKISIYDINLPLIQGVVDLPIDLKSVSGVPLIKTVIKQK